MIGLAWEDCLWRVPVAIAYQLELLYWQREGNVFKRDDRAKILRALDGDA